MQCVFLGVFEYGEFISDVIFALSCPRISKSEMVTDAILKISFLAHRSRRLTGELIGYPWIRRPSVRPSSVRPFTFSNFFNSETAWPIKAKFYVEPPWEGGTKICINGQGNMIKMAAMPIYGKNLKNLLLQNQKSYDLETWQ